MKYLLLLIGFMFYTGVIISNPANEGSKESKQNEIIGVWSSYSVMKYQGIKHVSIEKIRENKYKACLRLKDGSRFVEFLFLNENGEYHTYNRYHEYYKIANGTLVAYDEEGFLFYLWKNGS